MEKAKKIAKDFLECLYFYYAFIVYALFLHGVFGVDYEQALEHVLIIALAWLLPKRRIANNHEEKE